MPKKKTNDTKVPRRKTKSTQSDPEKNETPERIQPPPLRTDDIPARAGTPTDNTGETFLNVVIHDDIAARAGKRSVKESE